MQDAVTMLIHREFCYIIQLEYPRTIGKEKTDTFRQFAHGVTVRKPSFTQLGAIKERASLKGVILGIDILVNAPKKEDYK